MKIYKIYNSEHCTYSTGGMRPRWTYPGKVWQRKQDVMAHLSLARNRYGASVVILEYPLHGGESAFYTIDAFETMYIKERQRALERRAEKERVYRESKSIRKVLLPEVVQLLEMLDSNSSTPESEIVKKLQRIYNMTGYFGNDTPHVQYPEFIR